MAYCPVLWQCTMTILPTYSPSLLSSLISDGSNSDVLEVLFGFDVMVHKNIYQVVIRVHGVAAFVMGKPSPPLWEQQHILWEGWQLYKVFFEAGSTPSAPVVHPSLFGFPFQNAFHKSHFLVSHYSMLCEFRLKHAVKQIHIWCKSAPSCCCSQQQNDADYWSYKFCTHGERILPINFLHKGAVLVE